ncbi:MAG TPA: hypothetical protein VMS65_06605 [Polyangiaceae bacterium]|nr:hypothetical protein [Polyangiaceae bacterium]
MAGYSGTPLPQKLGIKPEHRVVLLGAPKGFEKTLGAVPEGVRIVKRLAGKAKHDVIVCFVTEKAALKKDLPRLVAAMQENAGLWVAWPKKSSGVATDMTEHSVRELALPKGLVDNKVCAIDDTWSGLRCVIRLENRSGKRK